MGGSYLGNAGIFLVKTIFGLYLLIVMLRFVLQVVRADFYNPISQFIVKASSPPLKPLRRVIPSIAGLDAASIVLMVAIKLLELFVVGLLLGHFFDVVGVLVRCVSDLLDLAVDVFFFAILIQVILSWVSPGGYNPVISLIYSISEPVLRPARRLLPAMHGFDLSPIVAMVGLKLVTFLAVYPLRDLARALDPAFAYLP